METTYSATAFVTATTITFIVTCCRHRSHHRYSYQARRHIGVDNPQGRPRRHKPTPFSDPSDPSGLSSLSSLFRPITYGVFVVAMICGSLVALGYLSQRWRGAGLHF